MSIYIYIYIYTRTRAHIARKRDRESLPLPHSTARASKHALDEAPQVPRPLNRARAGLVSEENASASVGRAAPLSRHLATLNSTAKGFEPLRAEPNGFRVHLLGRSDTLSWEGTIYAHSVARRGASRVHPDSLMFGNGEVPEARVAGDTRTQTLRC